MYYLFIPALVSIVVLGLLRLTEHIWFRYDDRPMLEQIEAARHQAKWDIWLTESFEEPESAV